MTVLAIDPGSEQSAWVLWDGIAVTAHGKEPNERVREMLVDRLHAFVADRLVIEEIASYGMPVGREVFETVFWSGRFWEAATLWTRRHRMPRREVKLHFCGQVRAKDAHIRQALIDRFGGKLRAIGRKASQGPLYGLKSDEWQALALAVTWYDLHVSAAPEASGAPVSERR